MYETMTKEFQHTTFEHSYRIILSMPKEQAPINGFPTLYILDGNAYGTMLTEICKVQWRRPEKTHIVPMNVVHIDYNTDQLFHPLRVYDFTPPAKNVTLPPKPNGEPWPVHGGAKEFLGFIEKVVQPFVYHQASVDRDNQILFGHSLGGLFVLYTLFNQPNLFQHYLSCSPSIWWNECEILTYERTDDFLKDKKLFIAAEGEGRLNMYDHAFSLAEKLKQRFPGSIAFKSPIGENHMSIVPSVVSEGMRFFHSG